MNISLHISSNTCAKTAIAETAWSEIEVGEGMQIFSLLGIDKLFSNFAPIYALLRMLKNPLSIS